MKIFFVFFALIAAASCAESVGSQTVDRLPSRSVVSSVPDGWVLYPNSQVSDSVLQCAARSQREWRVEQKEDSVKISLDARENHRAVLPAAIRSQKFAFGLKGSRSVEQVADGWLVGADAGEFGGGLWWFSFDGKVNKKLSGQNIVGFAKTANGILALAGLSHLGFDDGKIFKIVGETAANRKIETLTELGSAPRAFVGEAPDSILVLAGDSLIRVKTSGATEKLFSAKYRYLYPNSMVVSPSGVITVGMRHFVTRLTPINKGYNEEWFVPSDCTQFKERDFDCVCTSKEKR